jgi:hypothetical protein
MYEFTLITRVQKLTGSGPIESAIIAMTDKGKTFARHQNAGHPREGMQRRQRAGI